MMKKNKMKMLLMILLVITVIAVIATFVIVSRLSHPTDNRVLKEKRSFTGMLSNAYITKNDNNEIVIFYQGNYYIAYETAEEDYTGVADVELSKGRIVKIYAKDSVVEGMLDSYSEKFIQIEGYEKLECVKDIPVYRVDEDKEETPVSQKKLSDLMIGNSKIKLVVAEGKACAVIQYQEDRAENIRVLLKNGEKNTYTNFYISCDCDYQVGNERQDAGKIVSAVQCIKECRKEKEIRLHSQNGQLFLCDANGNRIKEPYEGDFILRKSHDGIVLINELPVEQYIRYVLPSEMPVSFSYEALKAQAVCARTFAYGQLRNTNYAKYGANLDDTTAYQVYHASSTYQITDQAVSDTEGMVMTYQGKLTGCYYYSTSAGYSENLEVWEAKSPDYLVCENHTRKKKQNLSRKRNFHKFITKKVPSYDMESPYYRWTARISNKLGMDEKYGRLKKIKINKRSRSGYVLSMTMVFEKGKRTYHKENDIRYALGKYLAVVKLSDGSKRTDYRLLPSACFEISSQKKGSILLKGGGFGHGIGMSQYGADGMGREGKTWEEILQYYYQGIEIRNIYSNS